MRSGRQTAATDTKSDHSRESPADNVLRYSLARRNLLSRPEPALLGALDQALAALAKAYPVPAAHRADLPLAVRDLSRILTAERGELSRSYWSAPRFLAAYLHYFLPWNLYRLAWLLPGLDIPLEAGAHILDLGSGPLTLPLALWCARPELRSLPLTFLCSDVAQRPMELGRAALSSLMGSASPWRVKLVPAPMEKILRAPPEKAFACILAGNALNELCSRSGLTDSAILSRLEKLLAHASSLLSRDGRLFFLEPGTRLGGKLISLARKTALQQGFLPLAPCTHSGPCPMQGAENAVTEMEKKRPAPPFSGWCHFIHPATLAPRTLTELGLKARLEKDRLALSCLLLRLTPPADAAGSASPFAATCGNSVHSADTLDDLEALYAEIMEEDARVRSAARNSNEKNGRRPADPRKGKKAATGTAPPSSSNALSVSAEAVVRVLSSPIRLPNQSAPGRYACCEKGLGLLLDALHVPSGASVTLPWPEQEERDAKTGALLLRRQSASSPKRAPQTRARRFGKH
jgi:hypothetical protein